MAANEQYCEPAMTKVAVQTSTDRWPKLEIGRKMATLCK